MTTKIKNIGFFCKSLCFGYAVYSSKYQKKSSYLLRLRYMLVTSQICLFVSQQLIYSLKHLIIVNSKSKRLSLAFYNGCHIFMRSQLYSCLISLCTFSERVYYSKQDVKTRQLFVAISFRNCNLISFHKQDTWVVIYYKIFCFQRLSPVISPSQFTFAIFSKSLEQHTNPQLLVRGHTR